MSTTRILPNIGSPVSSGAFDEAAIGDMSIGELVYATTLFNTELARRMANPATAHEFAQFILEHGTDWSGFKPTEVTAPCAEHMADDQAVTTAEDPAANNAPNDQPQTQAEAAQCAADRPLPTAPENYYDTLPGIAHMLRQHQQATEAVLTHFAGHLAPAIGDQTAYLGAPVGVKAYRDTAAYFREVLKFSRHQTKKIHDRVPYVAWTPGRDPEWAAYQPKLTKVAKSFAEGSIPAENLDRIIGLDQDLTKYIRKVDTTPEYKDEILAAFEDALVEAAETATPDELSAAKTRWANKIAHAIDPDGPPVVDALRKPADNAVHTKNYDDGSGKIWMHATAPVYAAFKNWSLHQLNYQGTPVDIPPQLLEFLTPDQDSPHPDHESQEPSINELAAAVKDLNDLKPAPEADTPAAQDATGTSLTRHEIASLDQLTTGQRLGAILIGMVHTMVTMDPQELGAKKAHGTAAQLMIVQDVETAYATLGVGALPEAVRRPRGPAGILPPIIRRSNPDEPTTPIGVESTTGQHPPAWTPYLSEAVNIGPMHPHDAAILACDSTLVGHIWAGPHDVLAQHRAHRLFTPTQRRAILARDRGCQAPGCTLPAVYCQIHHITEWHTGGPTDVDNAITLCAHHHAAVHNEKWTIRRHNGLTFFQPAPGSTPHNPYSAISTGAYNR
ncbi:MAG TPA: HNH endonuclease signature motif containing protein [Enteractinococcus sp.]